MYSTVGHSTNLLGIPTGLLASTAFNDYPLPLHISGVLETNPARMHIDLLYDDGLFEEEIPLTIAICAEILWNPYRDDGEFLQLGLSPYYRMR